MNESAPPTATAGRSGTRGGLHPGSGPGRFFRHLPLLLLLACLTPTALAERPRVYAVEGATVVVAPGETIESATVLIRDGLIVAVGNDIDVPHEAVVLDGAGRWVYAGLIDASSDLGIASSPGGGSAGGGGRGQRAEARQGAVHPLSRIHPEKSVRDSLTPFAGEGAKAMEKVRELGFTASLAVPGSGILRGSSTAILLNEDRPVSGLILRDGVAQHAGFERGGFGDGYPTSLMGVVAALRQVFLDSSRYSTWQAAYTEDPSGMRRPEMPAAFVALADVIAGEQPIVFHTDSAADTLLAGRLAREFELRLIVAASGSDWEMADQIGSAGFPLILSVGLPDKPKVKEADRALAIDRREMRRYLEAHTGPGLLHAAGARFAFTLSGLKNNADLGKNMRKIIEGGLPEDVALAAWTTVPAGLLGLDRALGTVSPGKIANLLVADGPLFGKESKIREVFVDGVRHEIEVKEKPAGDPNAVVDPRGTWSVVFEIGSRTMQREWIITGEPGAYGGTGETRGGTVTFDAVELAGNALTVTFPGGERGPMEITVIVEGENFEGTTEMGPRSATLAGTRTAGPDGGGR